MGRRFGMGRAELARQKKAARMMVGIGLQCHLHNLVREILAGDTSKLSEFQQFVQYAPAETKMKMLERLDGFIGKVDHHVRQAEDKTQEANQPKTQEV